MFVRTKKLVAATFASALLAVGVMAPTAAAQDQDGLVNVAIGDITIEDVSIGVGAQIVANVCDVQVGPIAVLATQVDRSGDSETVCTAEAGDVTITQN